MPNIQHRIEEVHEHILSFVSVHGYGPTYRDLQESTGFPLASLHEYVARLRESGALVKPQKAHTGRTIYPTRDKETA